MHASELAGACAQEIEALHAFFVDWFRGTLPDSDAAWARVERVLAPGFCLIAPSGQRLERSALLSGIRGVHGSQADAVFEIWTKNVELVRADEELVAVRYEEWQRRGTEVCGRISSALFRRDAAAPHGVAWLAVHETWLPEADPSGA